MNKETLKHLPVFVIDLEFFIKTKYLRAFPILIFNTWRHHLTVWNLRISRNI